VQDPGRLEQLHERAVRSASIEYFARMLWSRYRPAG